MVSLGSLQLNEVRIHFTELIAAIVCAKAVCETFLAFVSGAVVLSEVAWHWLLRDPTLSILFGIAPTLIVVLDDNCLAHAWDDVLESWPLIWIAALAAVAWLYLTASLLASVIVMYCEGGIWLKVVPLGRRHGRLPWRNGRGARVANGAYRGGRFVILKKHIWLDQSEPLMR